MLIGRVLPCVESQPQTTAANSGTFMHQLTLTVSMRELQSHSIMENHRSMDYIDLLKVHHLACICTSFQHWQRTPFTYFQFCPLTFFFKSCIKMLIGKHANLKLSKALSLSLSLFSLPRFHAAFVFNNLLELTRCVWKVQSISKLFWDLRRGHLTQRDTFLSSPFENNDDSQPNFVVLPTIKFKFKGRCDRGGDPAWTKWADLKMTGALGVVWSFSRGKPWRD